MTRVQVLHTTYCFLPSLIYYFKLWLLSRILSEDFPAQSGNSPFWGCAGDLVEMVVKVHCGTVLGNAFSTWRQMRPPKQSHNAVIALWQPGCSLNIGDRRIIQLLHWILRLMFGSLRRFLIQTWSRFQNILRYRYIRLLEFLIKTLDNRSPAQPQSGEQPIKGSECVLKAVPCSLLASSPIWASETSLARTRVLARLASLAQIGELASRLSPMVQFDNAQLQSGQHVEVCVINIMMYVGCINLIQCPGYCALAHWKATARKSTKQIITVSSVCPNFQWPNANFFELGIHLHAIVYLAMCSKLLLLFLQIFIHGHNWTKLL